MSNTLQRGDRLPASGGKAIRQRRINAADDALMVDQGLALSLTRFYRSFIVVSISYSIFEERNSFPDIPLEAVDENKGGYFIFRRRLCRY
jgi:hypothetical protein